MAHRDVHVYNLPALAAAVEGQVLEPAQKRESALKFLTRSLACMADGQGGSRRRRRGDHHFPLYPVSRPVWTLRREELSLTAAGWASSSIEGRIAVEYFDPSPEVQASKYAFRAHRQTVDGADHVFPINAIAYHPM
jgi:cell cycle arrest protein BUB3